MSKKVIRFTGSPDSLPEQWLRINHITEQPGPGSAYRVTIEPMEGPWQSIATGEIIPGATREDALANLDKAKARGPL